MFNSADLQLFSGGGGDTGFYPKTIDQSLRFNDDDSAYLSRTPSVAGNRKTWTWSGWVKRGNLGTGKYLFAAGTASSDRTYISIGSDDRLYIVYVNSTYYGPKTSMMFRDPSAWYHIIVAYDTTQATESDRVKVYVNGELQALTQAGSNAVIPQNSNSDINSTSTHYISSQPYSAPALTFDGYMAEVHFCDGTAYTADDFGELKSGIWVAKEPSVTYGTNGFYLDCSIDLTGPELVTNGTFDTDTSGWSAQNATLSQTSGQMRIVDAGDYSAAYQAITTEIGKTYLLSFEYLYKSGLTILVNFGFSASPPDGTKYFDEGESLSTPAYGTYTYAYTATSTTSYVILGTNSTNTMGVDNVSVKEFSADDLSGNANDWTPNNLAATDVVLDSPTNNFATFNPLNYDRGTYSEGSLRVVTSSTVAAQYNLGDMAIPDSGKWYFEFNQTAFASSNTTVMGISDERPAATTKIRVLYYSLNGNKVIDQAATSSTAYGASWTNGDIIGVLVDRDDGSVTFYKNGVSQGAISYTFSDADYFPYITDNNVASTSTGVFNFGQDSTFAGNTTAGGFTDANGIGDFYYAPPTGALALCTANLPAPTFDPAADVTPEDHFNVVTYSGTGSSQSITGVGFQPDLVWIKSRNGSTKDHNLYDSVRGVDKVLFSSGTFAEATVDGVGSFDLDGFTVDTYAGVNAASDTYVAWCFKAGGTAITNTDGTITSSVSANVDAGFSIATFTATTSSSDTVGHGLSQTPEIIIFKTRNSAMNWYVETNVIDGSWDYLNLNTTNAAINSSWPGTPNATTVPSRYTTAYSMVQYCWHSVEGFSKIGVYTGNGSTDGVFVYCNFKPAFVLIKRTDSTSNWTILDNEREGYNVDNDPLYPNLTNAEGTTDLLDFLSNGFKLRTTDASVNASGGTYLFMAFAEDPFRYSTGR